MKVDLARVIQRLIRMVLFGDGGGVKPLPAPIKPDPVVKVPTKPVAALAALRDPVAVQSPAFRAREMKASWDMADPDILAFASAFLKELKRQDLPFFAFQFYRGRKEQEAAFVNGTTKAHFGESPHNFGMAVDIVHFGKYWDLTNVQWSLLGVIGKEVARKKGIKITWGGDWKFYDPAHWELSDWQERKDRRVFVQVEDFPVTVSYDRH